MIERIMRFFGYKNSYEWFQIAKINWKELDMDGWNRKQLDEDMKKLISVSDFWDRLQKCSFRDINQLRIASLNLHLQYPSLINPFKWRYLFD